MAWKLDSDRPIYTQILEVIQYQIVAGRYQPGERLPSVRDLASEAGVNPNTMQRAFAELERNGLVMAQRTSGRVVTENMEMISEVRNKLAREQIREFIDKMKKLGFEKKEILSLLEEDGEPKTAE
ncbi:GntR family transcriptional regulator [bacterium 1xD8-48]|jgi:GntR family transcriptional regulator|nr:GntR family transcriptional regulator [Lachnospiraceae bacterium]MCI9324970.1 GntR family transcriptional regulator [Lachnospiraceae bacterium]NBJ96517.1 GntR family transcriptional regulator [bacterium 1xD8-48]